MLKYNVVKALLFILLIPITTFAKLPKAFQIGFASAPYHIYGAEGCPNSNWAFWESLEIRPSDKQPTIDLNQRSGNGCGFYKNVSKEIAGLLETGSTIYRTGIDWSQLFPTLESWLTKTPDIQVINHYNNLLDALHANKITPIITLHHFVHPQWWHEKGSFEKEENIQDLVDFGKFIVNQFGSKIPYIITINEPGPYMVQGYLRGEFPPGKWTHEEQMPSSPFTWSKGWTLAGTVLKNILSAHVETYKAIKEIAPQIQVGLAHNVLHFEPNQKYNPGDIIFAKYFDYVFNGSILPFLQTGKFKFWIPGYSKVQSNKYADQKFQDFIGLNYYTVTAINIAKQTTHRAGQTRTDMQYPMCPEGFARALNEVAVLKLPIIITEAGLADAKDDRRELWFKEHVKVLEEAIAQGLNILGATWWTLTDNFEWNNGFNGNGRKPEDNKHCNPKFGIYAMDRTNPNNITFTLRKGAAWIINLMQEQRAGQEDLLNPFGYLIAARG